MRRRRKSAIVPRLVLGASFASVVPACALACGGPDPLLGNDAAEVGFSGDVAAAFDNRVFRGDVAAAFDVSPPFDATTETQGDDADAADALADSADDESSETE